MDCPSSDQIRAFIDGRLSQVDWSRIKTHVDGCGRCRGSVDGRNETVAVATLPKGADYSEFFSIDGYDIHEEIHRGGQGIVFKGTQRSTGRDVALKVLLYGRFSDEHQRNRLKREMALVATLRHPNIVTLYDSGADGPNPYLAMEYIEGQPLHRFLHEHPMERKELLGLFLKVCDAVSYAHEKGIIHRDLKPGNIQVDEYGEPYVLDFGLAKVLDPTLGAAAETLTTTGAFVGTPAYASPEQARGDRGGISERTDVYSLGVILYEMLTGRYPYEVDGSATQIIKQICDAIPRKPSAQSTGIGDELDRIILKAIEKRPEQRYKNAEHLAADIRRYLAGEPIEAKRVPLYRLRKNIIRFKIPLIVCAIVCTLSLVVLRQYFANQAFLRQLQNYVQFIQEESAQSLASPGLVSRLPGIPDSLREKCEKSIELLNRHLTDEPRDAHAWHMLGRAYVVLRQYQSAVNSFNRAIALDENQPEQYYNLGIAYLLMNQFEQAKSPILAALKLDPQMINGWLNLAYAQDRLQEHHGAISSYQKALELDADNVIAMRGVARNYGSSGQLEKAAVAFKHFVDKFPNDFTSWWGLARLDFELDHFDESLRDLEHAIKHAPADFKGSILADQAVYTYYGGNTELGLELARQCISNFPDDEGTSSVLSRFLATIPEASREIRQLALQRAQWLSQSPRAQSYRDLPTTRAIAHWLNEDYAEAKRNAEMSNDIDDDDAWPQLILTAVAVHDQRFEEATRRRAELAQSKPKDKHEWKLFERILKDVDQALANGESIVSE